MPLGSSHSGSSAASAVTVTQSEGDEGMVSRGSRTLSELRAPRASGFGSGDMVGRYVLGRRLGAGGMGEVFIAHDAELDREVALKLIHARRQRDASGCTERECARLRFEAQALARLSHPNVVQVHEVGEHQGQTFLAMELVEGPTFAAWRPESLAELLEAYVQAGRGLAAAHAAGLVHRDFKPGNVLRGLDGRVRVADFGLAAPTIALEAERARTLGDESDEPARSNSVGGPGTLPYMAPEQAFAGTGGPAADQFSFCVALFEAVYGVRPFPARGVMELLCKLDACTLEFPAQLPAGSPWTRVPRWLRRLLRRGLARRPADRFASMDALLAELGRERGSSWKRAGSAALVSTMTALTVLALVPSAPRERSGGPAIGSELAGVWDAPQREALAAAFAELDQPWAASSETAVVAGFEHWAQRYRDASRNARLLGTRVERSTARACLDGQRLHAQVTLEALTGAVPELLEGAVAAVDALPEPSRCLHLQLTGPDAALEREELLPQLRALADVAAQRGLGNHELARAGADAILATARERGLVSLELAALRQRGLARIETGHRAEGLADLERARSLAVRNQDPRSEAELWVDLAWAGRHLDDAGLRRERLQLAQAHVDALLSGPAALDAAATDRHAQLLAARVGLAAALDALATPRPDGSHLREAEVQVRSALARTEGSAAGDTGLGIELLHGLARVRGEAGLLEQAEYDYLRALARAARVRGPRHPANAQLWFDAGALAHERGEIELARERLETARSIRRASLRVDHPKLAQSELGLAQLELGLGNDQAARDYAEAALASLERSARAGADSDALPETHRVLGQLEARAERWDRAVHHLELALAGMDQPGVQRALVELELGRALAVAGRHERALALLEASLPVIAARLGPQRCHKLIPSYQGHAAAAAALGRHALARESYASALACVRSSDHETRARLERALAPARNSTD